MFKIDFNKCYIVPLPPCSHLPFCFLREREGLVSQSLFLGNARPRANLDSVTCRWVIPGVMPNGRLRPITRSRELQAGVVFAAVLEVPYTLHRTVGLALGPQ